MVLIKSAAAVSSKRKLFTGLALFSLVIIFVTGCRNRLPAGDPGNGGLILPGNFEAVVVADNLGGARHIAVNDNGDIYVKLRAAYPDGGNVVLRDENNDGKADIIKKFSLYSDPGSYGTAMRIHNGYLYFSSTGTVYRCKLIPGKLVPDSNLEV